MFRLYGKPDARRAKTSPAAVDAGGVADGGVDPVAMSTCPAEDFKAGPAFGLIDGTTTAASTPGASSVMEASGTSDLTRTSGSSGIGRSPAERSMGASRLEGSHARARDPSSSSPRALILKSFQS
jgi:hypothetical protein